MVWPVWRAAQVPRPPSEDPGVVDAVAIPVAHHRNVASLHSVAERVGHDAGAADAVAEPPGPGAERARLVVAVTVPVA